MFVNPDFETPATFSRRVHALERVADKVPITNKVRHYVRSPRPGPPLSWPEVPTAYLGPYLAPI